MEPCLTDDGAKSHYCVYLRGVYLLHERHAIAQHPDFIDLTFRKLEKCLAGLGNCAFRHLPPKKLALMGTAIGQPRDGMGLLGNNLFDLIVKIRKSGPD